MKPRSPYAVWLILFFLQTHTAHSQWQQTTGDSLVDVFPLSIGNEWTYRYFTLTEIWPAGTPYETRTDSGRVVYYITGRTSNTDSTRWQFEVQRDLMRHQILWYLGRDTTYPIRDSSSIELIESNLGQHQLYRNADPYVIRLDVFPFTRGFLDTTMIYRFRQVGTGATITFRSWIDPPPSPLFRSSFTFKKAVGLIRNSYHSGTMDVYSTNEHVLLSSIITSVGQQEGSATPSSFVLYPSYPNPFNPSTTIDYLIPTKAHITLRVFDVLGREVASLVDAIQEPGYKSTRWNAGNVACGVYYYQLRAGAFVETRTMLLVK